MDCERTVAEKSPIASQNCVDSVVAASLENGPKSIASALDFEVLHQDLAKRSPRSRDLIVQGIESPLPPVREKAIRCALSLPGRRRSRSC
jgi:hypothetical protein